MKALRQQIMNNEKRNGGSSFHCIYAYCFAAKVNRLNYANVHTVVLMTNNATEEGVREFVWMRYDLKTGAVTRGIGNGLISDWRNPDACTPTPKEYIVSVAL